LPAVNDRDAALVALGRLLRSSGYRFTTITPESHRRVNERADSREARDPRGVFGWSRPFRPEVLPRPMFELLSAAGAVVERDGLMISTVRFSTTGDFLFVHSAFPTDETDSVFFGPDTYRYLSMLRQHATGPLGRVVDVGCGSGAGGIAVAAQARSVVLADINERALSFSAVNVALAGATNVEIVLSDVLAAITGEIDTVIANPPYLRDDRQRTYRDGGGSFGEGLSLRIVREALDRLRPGGRLLLYTGSAIVEGRDPFREAAERTCNPKARSIVYEEIDPDVFGEELQREAYRSVDRLAVVKLIVEKQ
jgi:release factor glutamine methyltransferase